jgi:hypothetical protein
MKLNRFPAEKHEQIEQLIVFAKLMGLSGRDLVAIGGKIDREDRKALVQSNMHLVNTFQCLTIGFDSVHNLDSRFKLKTGRGAYNFHSIGWNSWLITSLKTKIKQTYTVDVYSYDLPRIDFRTKCRYAILLDIAQGKLVLNF